MTDEPTTSLGDEALTLVRRYYAALDAHEYDVFETLLAPSFVQRRPDRTFEGRDAFVGFMRDDRPVADTSHDLAELFGTGDRVTARGRLVDATGEALFEFADVFEIDAGRIVRLETYTR
ncbi:nuclear transport factor 2 family protein [Halovivax gelatinilyticus]|uniref:nuclear transport factor 2 family protein n=1 Tax=Halovivax gelatinilyticus TaxID=2961597 RepID=UPI0020CA509F|nr:nuclear transport factor 2 family protein [Halovivax gelatinilyticus]